VSYRLLALDIDGTLLRTDKVLSPRTRRALDEARAAGIRLVLVTGRRYPSARKVAEDLGGDVPLVLHNGALVVERGELVRAVMLPGEAAIRALQAGRRFGLPGVLHCGARGEGRLLCEEAALQSRLVGYYLERSRRDVEVVEDLERAAASDDVVQVMFGGPREDVDAVAPRLSSELADLARVERTVYPGSGVGILDVLARGISKAEALGFLQGRWGIAAAETLAIGDNWNDHDMLERAGLGLVMGNADPEMRKLGLPVLPTNDEDGVAVAIEAHVLSLGSPMNGPCKSKRG
jgi:5-amino-6-(5-phospho-D-ribitylamino)uracil phosphatase